MTSIWCAQGNVKDPHTPMVSGVVQINGTKNVTNMNASFVGCQTAKNATLNNIIVYIIYTT